MRTSMILMLVMLLATSIAPAQTTVTAPPADAAPAATATTVTPANAAAAAPAANNTQTAAQCLPAQIRVHEQHFGVPMRLGEWLTLVVSGQCASNLKDQLKKSGAAPGKSGDDSAVTLLLNDVPMHDIPMVLAQGTDASQVLLNFRLLRQAEIEDNLTAWNAFLRNNESCCEHAFGLREMDVAIALAIGTAPAAALGNSQNIQFRVEDREVVAATFWALFVVFFVGFWLCLKSPTLLRDTGTGEYSLAKSQMAFWGLIVALCFAGVWFVIGSMEPIPNQVLVLLGISAATGWLSPHAGTMSADNDAKTNPQGAAVVVAPPAAGVNAETPEDAARTKAKAHGPGVFLRQICSDGEGLGVHRVQAVAWTLILGVVFVCEVTTVISMPVFSTNLLLLLGISNGTYLTLKTNEKPSN